MAIADSKNALIRNGCPDSHCHGRLGVQHGILLIRRGGVGWGGESIFAHAVTSCQNKCSFCLVNWASHLSGSESLMCMGIWGVMREKWLDVGNNLGSGTPLEKGLCLESEGEVEDV